MKFLFSYIKKFAVSTTIHGINYIFENGISVIERLLWMVVLFYPDISKCKILHFEV